MDSDDEQSGLNGIANLWQKSLVHFELTLPVIIIRPIHTSKRPMSLIREKLFFNIPMEIGIVATLLKIHILLTGGRISWKYAPYPEQRTFQDQGSASDLSVRISTDQIDGC
ncbi:hypothetical protein B0O99DRAFT_685901 [Bisporella sp. PMI_857]|nr:hypothetical protein B0O99DRAFT_685901 [Bisporella sp. PMI_857]